MEIVTPSEAVATMRDARFTQEYDPVTRSVCRRTGGYGRELPCCSLTAEPEWVPHVHFASSILCSLTLLAEAITHVYLHGELATVKYATSSASNADSAALAPCRLPTVGLVGQSMRFAGRRDQVVARPEGPFRGEPLYVTG